MRFNFIIIFSLLCLVCSGAVFAQDSQNIFTYKVGDYEVILLVESRGQGNSSIIIADNAVIQKYIPGGNFPSEVNTFLIRTPKNTIMVDTGYGTTIFESLKNLKIDPANIDTVLITHMHGDHISGLQKDGKATFPNAAIYVSEQEKKYWSDNKIMAKAPEARQKNFQLAQSALAIYGSKVKTFKPGEINSKIKELLPGIMPVEAFGHTPGHTAYMVTSGKDKLLIIGDLINVMAIQIPAPDIATTFDIDSKAAAESRKKILKYVTENKIPIAGMHLIYPAIGLTEEQNKGEYKFTPVKN